MKLGWHCVRGRWFYGTDMCHEETPATPRPSAVVMYTEGPCKEIQKWLRTGETEYQPEKNFGVELEDVIDELDAELADLSAEQTVPDVVTRVDDGQLADYIENGFVVDNGYLSTTDSGTFRRSAAAYRYRIVGLKPGCGAKVNEFSQYESENEFLFNRGSAFRVISEKEFNAPGQRGKEYVLKYAGTGHTDPRKMKNKMRCRMTKCLFCGAWFDSTSWECEVCGAT